MFKRGISPIISVVLLIAFVIGIFILISVFIRNTTDELIDDSGGRVEVFLASNDLNLEILDAEAVDFDTVKVRIENKGESMEGFGIRVVGVDGADTVTVSKNLNQLDIVNEEVNFDESKVGAVVSVEVYPVIDGKIYSGNVKKKELDPVSCAVILTSNPSSGSGIYTIYPDGTSISVYCDMDTDGGGWTRISSLIINEEDRRAWVDAEPIVNDYGCSECSDIWPKYARNDNVILSYVNFRLGEEFGYTESRIGTIIDTNTRGIVLFLASNQVRAESESDYEGIEDYIYLR